jgi:hypothetical protein
MAGEVETKVREIISEQLGVSAWVLIRSISSS